MQTSSPVIAVLGASGLIGNAVTEGLQELGFPVVPIARSLSKAQRTAWEGTFLECPIATLSSSALTHLFEQQDIAIVVNCLGVLQDTVRDRTEDIHGGFVRRLLAALGESQKTILLVHLSVPGVPAEDRTRFSRTKRDAERSVGASPASYAILRPGFVIAPAAYGGSALVRSFAALPFGLPEREASRPFASTHITDIVATISFLARDWPEGGRPLRLAWDIMERDPSNVGSVVEAFRRRFGGPRPWLRLPSMAMDIGAALGDVSAHLGWSPPIRSTAIDELRRGVSGDPEPWIAATGIVPASTTVALRRLSSTVQERWFGRLYQIKALIVCTLVFFWVASGLIAFGWSFDAATSILTRRGFPLGVARFVTILSSLLDLSVGIAIVWRPTCRKGLVGGIGLSAFYMVAAALLTPDLWIEPLGALVKTGPAIVLMLCGLLVLDNR